MSIYNLLVLDVKKHSKVFIDIFWLSYIGVETNKEWLTPNELAESAVQGWMNSPGHRQNILTPHWRSEGIGVAVSNDGKVLATQDFC